MRAFFRENRLRVWMVISNVLLSIVPVITIGIIAYSFHYNSMKENVLRTVNILFSQVNGRLEEYFDSVNLFSQTLFYDKYLQKLLLEEDKDWVDRNQIKSHLDVYLQLHNSIKGVYFIDKQGTNYTSSSARITREQLDAVSQYGRAAPSNKGLSFIGAFDVAEPSSDRFIAVRVVKSVIEPQYLQEIGIGVIILDRIRLIRILQDSHLNSDWEVFVIDSDHSVVLSTNEAYYGKQLDAGYTQGDGQKVVIHDKPYLVKTSSVNKAGWKLVAAIPEQQLFREGEAYKYGISIIVLVMFVLIFAIAAVFNLRITRPIQKLTAAFAKVATGELKLKVRFSAKNEITAIADSFNHMVSEIDHLTQRMVTTQKQLYETELEKKQLQMHGLQAQINSHFLYNTLHCIRGMAISNSVAQMSGMIDYLVLFLRYSTREDEFTTLRQELEHVDTYVQIQNVRFGNRLKIQFAVDSRLMDQRVLKLFLQPLVENAIFHGLEQKHGQGTIRIKATVKEGMLLIHVIDNGTGMPPALVDQLNGTAPPSPPLRPSPSAPSAPPSPPPKPASGRRGGSGIGMANIKRRIVIYYGPEYGVQVKSWPNLGTAITLKIPYEGEPLDEV